MIGYTPVEQDIRQAAAAVTPPPPATLAEVERASYIDGLRALADVLEDHPEVPLPHDGHGDSGIAIMFLSGTDPRSALAAAARAIPCNWRKDASDAAGDYPAYFDMYGSLHGLKLHLTAYRDAVCERIVTGTREVTEMVKDPAALAAVPEVEVTRTVEDIEWVCGSVLAPTAQVAGTEQS